MKRLMYAAGNEDPANPGVSLKPEIASNYVGIPFGSSAGFLPAVTSAPGPSVLVKGAFNKPFIIMTAAEVQLNLAEAKQRYASVNLTGTAQSYFEAGVKESYRALGATASDAARLLSSGVDLVDFTASTDKLKAIAYQKWLALANFNGLEAWSEYRKNGFPVTPQSKNYVTDAKRPVRLFYPGTELGSNGANVNAQGTIDPLSTRIFWDVD
jgi:hypothetical protein